MLALPSIFISRSLQTKISDHRLRALAIRGHADGHDHPGGDAVLHRAGGALAEVRQGVRPVVHRGDHLHPAGRLPAVLRRIGPGDLRVGTFFLLC